MTEVWQVKEVRRILKEIDSCGGTSTGELTDGQKWEAPCTIQSMCDSCIEKFVGLMSWADNEEEQKEESNGNETQTAIS